MAKFELKALITGVDKLSPQLEGIRKNIAGFQKNISKAGFGKMGLADLITGGALAAPFIAGAKAAIDFESQMADVKKVVDFDTPEQFKQMGNDILNMSKRLPMAAEDIAKIVAAAGQAGIAKEELARFAEDAVKMGVAFDTTAEESGQMMKVWRTSFKMTQDEVVALADKINYLGNQGASTKDVADMVTRVGSLGQISGVATGEVSALAATLSKVGVKSDVGVTGLKNFMLALTQGAAATKTQQLAFKALRLDSKKLAVDMQKDAKGTILDVLSRLNKIEDSKRPAILTQIFGKESIESVAKLLDNLELLKTNIKDVGDKTKYTSSMQKEYEARAATTANNIQLLKNQFKAAAINLGSIFLPAINDTLAVISPFASMLGDLIRDNPQLVKSIAMVGVSLIGMKLAVFGVTKAVSLLGDITKMSPFGLFLRLAAVSVGLIIANWDKIVPFFKNLWNTVSRSLDPFFGVIETIPTTLKAAWDSVLSYFKTIYDSIMAMVDKVKEARDYLVPTVKPAGFDNMGLAGYQGYQTAASIDAMNAYKFNQALPNLQMPTPASIVNPQAQKVNGEILVKFDNAPAGMRVEQAKTDSPLMLKTQQKVGRRNIGAN